MTRPGDPLDPYQGACTCSYEYVTNPNGRRVPNPACPYHKGS